MSVIESIKRALAGDDGEKTYHYECRLCSATFESTEPTVQTVTCPQCGSDTVREWLPEGGESR
ncbi:hypothetical protein [Haloarchaeobius sp. TZWWS8]|uniref:hypothetical protein n=1 Tax=Haloarchaeobius sp. TZWWS8 TaxID=3446121 RepID=UPI003EBD5B4B